MVDDQFAPLTTKIKEAIYKLANLYNIFLI
jgi:hypothetical protein